jgi:phosphoribosylglycinamide formyltransferase-1
VSRLAVLASGNGSNFEALAEALRARPAADGPRHECVLLVYDRVAAYAARRAERLGIFSRYVTYYQREAAAAEAEITAALREARVDVVALAGFMRILSGGFVAAWRGRLVNVHPSLLPAWPGAHAIERAYEAGERRFGVTVHFVDEGMDTGTIIDQESFEPEAGESLEAIEARIHSIEHRIYPRAVLKLLDDRGAEGAGT